MAKKMKKEDFRKRIIAKAIVDPAFRRKLLNSPEEVFQDRLSASDKAAVDRLRHFLPAVDGLVTSLAGEVLCGTGGGCGGLT